MSKAKEALEEHQELMKKLHKVTEDRVELLIMLRAVNNLVNSVGTVLNGSPCHKRIKAIINKHSW